MADPEKSQVESLLYFRVTEIRLTLGWFLWWDFMDPAFLVHKALPAIRVSAFIGRFSEDSVVGVY